MLTHPRGEFRHVDDDPLMRADADLLFPSRARTANSTRRPSTLVTSASPVTIRTTGVAARWRISTAVPTALSPASRNSRIAFSAAFSMTMIITGVAKTGGKVASLNRFARCSGCTSNVNEPRVPTAIGVMGPSLFVLRARR